VKGYKRINNQFEFYIKTRTGHSALWHSDSFTFHSPTLVKHKFTKISAFCLANTF